MYALGNVTLASIKSTDDAKKAVIGKSDEIKQDVDRLIDQLESGEIDIKTFQEDVIDLLKEGHIFAYAIATSRGNIDQFKAIVQSEGAKIDPQGKASLNQILSSEGDYFGRYVDDLLNSEMTRDRAQTRLNNYAESIKKSFYAGQESNAIADGYKYSQRFLSPNHENCPDCKNYAGMGKQAIGILPPIGVACVCGNNCRCRMEFS